MKNSREDSLWGAAVLKMSFHGKDARLGPGFRVVYYGILKDMELTDSEVNKYIEKNMEKIMSAVKKKSEPTK